jgi:murein L,D-transpeptidase YafK
LEDSAFYKAIRVSYPNERDITYARARGDEPGGKIMIHGLPNEVTASRVGHPTIDWTQGCIAVTNWEMDEIWGMVDPGTPIEIHP